MTTTPPSSLPHATKRKKRRLTSKNSITKPQTREEQIKPAIIKKKRSLQPVSMATSPNISRSPSPSQPSPAITSDPVINTTPTPTTKRSIRAASAAISKREQDRDSVLSSSQSATAAEPTSPTKRSIRAASDAISKRELEKKLSIETSPIPDASVDESVEDMKKPLVKRKRKLNTQKAVVVPNSVSPSDDLELEVGTSVNSYSKYLDPKKVSTPSKATPITIGVTKKRKIVSNRSNNTSTKKKMIPPLQSPRKEDTGSIMDTEEEDQQRLDLSQHVILPNSSYIAHLRQPSTRRSSIDSSNNYYSDQSSSASYRSSPTSEFFDAASDFDDQQDIIMNSIVTAVEDNDDDIMESTTTDFMDFDIKSSQQDMMVNPQDMIVEPLPEEQKGGFWKSVLTFARFSSGSSNV